MLRRSLSIALAAVLTVGLAGPALATNHGTGRDTGSSADEKATEEIGGSNEGNRSDEDKERPPPPPPVLTCAQKYGAVSSNPLYMQCIKNKERADISDYSLLYKSCAAGVENVNSWRWGAGASLTSAQSAYQNKAYEQLYSIYLSYQQANGKCIGTRTDGGEATPPRAKKSRPIGEMVFRFYGTATNPTAAYTVSMNNFGEEGLADGSSYRVGSLKPTDPVDAGGNPRQPWSAYMAQESRDAKKSLNKVFTDPVGSDVTKLYEIKREQAKTNYTTGPNFEKVGGRCVDYSQPAPYQAGGVTGGFKEELAAATISQQGVVSYNNPGGLFREVEQYVGQTWKKSNGNEAFTARLLGLSGTNTALNMSTISSAQYVECGSPVNFPTYIGEDKVLERNEEGWPTRVNLPGLGEVKTTAVAAINIDKGCDLSFNDDSCFSTVYHADKDKDVLDAAYFRTVDASGDSIGKVTKKAGELDTFYGDGTQDGIVSKIKGALRSYYSGNSYKDLYPGKLNSQFKRIKGSGTNTQVVVEDLNVNELVEGTKIVLNPSFISLDPNLLPTLEEVGAGDVDDNTVDGPITEQPEDGPTIPNNPPQPTPDPNGFVWSIEAEATPYLEVKADQGPANTFEFRAKLESEWRSQAEAESFIDGLAVSSTTSGFNNAKGAWNSLASQVNGTPGVGLAAAQLTGEKRADFSGRDWDLKAIYEGLDTYTYVPQCNTGQKQGPGCESEGSAWNQAPVLNDDCNSPACYEPGQVVNNATRGGEGIGPSGTLPYTNYRIGGPGVKMGAWSYDFFKATGKDKAVYLAHEASRPTDIDVRYDANNPGAASWYVNGRYKTWDPIYGPPYAVYEPCTKWVPFDPPQYHSDGAEATYPATDSCYAGTKRDLIGYQPSGWKGWGQSGAYTRYNVADNLSGVAVDPETQRVVRSDTFGGAGCDDRNSTAWNYCSPVLAGKVTR